MGLIGFFLLIGAWPALHSQGFHFLTRTDWLPETGTFGIASLLWGTILVGLIALAVAVPVGFGAALFISEYAPRSLKRSLVSLVDLMAAVPSIVYAIWALFFLQAHLAHHRPVARRSTSARFLPFFRVNTPDSPVVVHVLGLHRRDRRRLSSCCPTITSIMREVFAQAPIGEREGRDRPGRDAVGDDPRRRDPVRAGRHRSARVMLGLGRALGETIVVYAIISPIFDLTTHPLQSGTNTIAAHIASATPESDGLALVGLLGAGLVLFLFTLVINTLAACRRQPIALRRRDGDLMTTLLAPDTSATGARARRTSAVRRRRVRIGGADPELVTHVVSAAAGALGLTWLVFERLVPMTGAIGFWLCWYAALPGPARLHQRHDARPGRRHRPAGRRSGHAPPG